MQAETIVARLIDYRNLLREFAKSPLPVELARAGGESAVRALDWRRQAMTTANELTRILEDV